MSVPSLLLLLVCVGRLPATELLDSLSMRRQESLYYQQETLPQNLHRLAASAIGLDTIASHYSASRDPYVRFNLVIAVNLRIRNPDRSDGRQAAVAFLLPRLQDGNPWVRTEAIYGIGLADLVDSAEHIAARFDDPSDLVFLHAVIAWHQVTGRVPPLTALQRERFRPLAESYGDNDLAEQELDDWIRTGAPERLPAAID